MGIIDGIKDKYVDYQLNKIDQLEMSINKGEGLEASLISPKKLMPDKLEITIKTLPKQLSIAKNMEHTVKSLKNNPKDAKFVADNGFFIKFEEVAHSLGVDKVGYATVNPEMIFQDRSIQFPYAMILIMEMDQNAMDNAPSPQTQEMGVITYDHLGKITNELAQFIRKEGFGAQASHPAGGFVVYPPLAQKAGLGFIGRHGLLITPEFGPRQRISAIFTSIQNLPVPDYSPLDTLDFCSRCGKCVKICPGNAIVEETLPSGEKRAKILGDNCHGCTICMRDCSFKKREYFQLAGK
ncbi:MAG: 4Fe-4S dicluster domain-containing protein [Methanobacteriaceae archaeon]